MESKTLPSVLIGLGVAFLTVSMLITGCSPGKWIKTSVPLEVAQELGQPGQPLPVNVPHDVGVQYFQMWQDRVNQRVQRDARVTALFQQNLQSSGDRVALVTSLGSQGIETAIPYVNSLPFGGYLATALVGIGALLFPRPGEAKAVKAAEDKGYDAGRAEAIDTLNKAPIT